MVTQSTRRRRSTVGPVHLFSRYRLCLGPHALNFATHPREISMAVSTDGAYAPGTELAGKVALITGAAKNIGRATALALAAGGAAVAINTRTSKDDAEKVAQDVRAAGGQAEVYIADIAKSGEVKSMAAAILKRFGRIDILVLNASVRSEKAF